MDRQKQWEKLEESLNTLSEVIDIGVFKEWELHPMTQFLMLQLQARVLEKEAYLESGGYLESDKSLQQAWIVRGAKEAYEDILDIKYEEALEEGV